MWHRGVLAECVSVANTDFQGRVCTESSAGATRETREGKWLNVDGGVFEGRATLDRNPDNSQRLSREGRLITSVFGGRLTYEEMKDAAGKISSRELIEGREVLADGVFEGRKQVDCNPDGSRRLIKEGRLMTRALSGRLTYEEMRDSAGKLASREMFEGRETLSGDGLFDGRKNLFCNPDNSQRLYKEGRLLTSTFQGKLIYEENKDPIGRIASRETVEGTWRVAPNLKLIGNIITQRSPDGTVIVKDNRRQVK